MITYIFLLLFDINDYIYFYYMQDQLDTVKALDENSYNALQKRLATVDPTKLNKIYSDYGGHINKLIMLCLRQTKDEYELVELDCIKRIVNLAPADERFLRSKDKVWAVRQHIQDKNEKYFMTKDYSHLIKKDRNQSMLETIMAIAKNGFAKLSAAEKDKYWKIGNDLVSLIEAFKKLTNEP